jgi:ketosteroid isomerase-like protein
MRASSILVTLALVPAFLACGNATPEAQPPVASATANASASAPPVASSAPPAASSAVVVAPPPAAAPMNELQLAALKAAADAINQHDSKKYVALFTRTAIHKEAATRDLVGRDEIARRMQLLFDAFPDFKFGFDRVWQKGDLAVATWHWTGTDDGRGFMGKRPTKKRAGIQGVTVGFFNVDGLLREVHVYEDGQTVLAQLDPAAKAGSFRAAPSDAPGALAVTPAAPADEDKNTQVVRAFYDALEAKKEADTAAAFTDDATVDDFALPPKPGKGPAAWKALLKSWTGNFGAFTELPLYNLMAVGDTVIVERVVRGSVGPNAAVTLHALDLVRLQGGKIASFGSYSNTLELVSQVGTKGLRRP